MDSSGDAIASSVLSAVLKIVLLIMVGAKLEIQGMLNGSKRKCLSALAMDVALPCLLFSSVLPEADLELFDEGWELLFWPLIYATTGAFLGAFCCIIVGIPMQHLGGAAACAAFPNVNGFPVSIISALGPALPKSPGGFSPLTFLALIQLTDGCVKYTLGPMIYRRDLLAVQRARAKEGLAVTGELPLGASLVSIIGDIEGIDEEVGSKTHVHSPKPNEGKTEFGLEPEQYKAVEPEWSRFDAGKLVWSSKKFAEVGLEPKPAPESSTLASPLLSNVAPEQNRLTVLAGNMKETVSQLMPPQVVAILLALAIGLGPKWVKSLLYDPVLSKAGSQPYLGFVFGTAKELGGGFVPLQMISLGGRLVNIVGPSGPLAAKGEAGPRGRAKLLKVSAAVAFARMIAAPVVCFFIALAADRYYLQHNRPLAFWAPALIVSAMPTANNMSTMADLVGSGRSISAASTAMQLLASPAILAVSLTFLLKVAHERLANDV